MQVVSERRPTEAEWGELVFAWKVCKHVRSNAIVLSKDLATVGIGAGQMSRVDSVRLAIEKARSPLDGAVLASDAYFPFPDGPQLAIDAGIDRDHPARRLDPRPGRRRGGRRRGRRDGVHRPAPLPPLTATSSASAATRRRRTRTATASAESSPPGGPCSSAGPPRSRGRGRARRDPVRAGRRDPAQDRARARPRRRHPAPTWS